jgi:hypothetical protein
MHSPEAPSVLLPNAPPLVEPPDLQVELGGTGLYDRYETPPPLPPAPTVLRSLGFEEMAHTIAVPDHPDAPSDDGSKCRPMNPPLANRPQSPPEEQLCGGDMPERRRSDTPMSKTQVIKNDLREQIQKLSDERLAEKAKEASRSRFVKSRVFAVFVISVILMNTLYLGVQAQIQIADEFERLRGDDVTEKDYIWQICDLCFCVLFAGEMALRMWSDGSHFLTGREKHWNTFDITVVSTSIVELILDFTGLRLPLAVSILRTLRVLRIIRLLRIGKVFRPIRSVIQNLQCILLALAGSVESFVAAILMFLIVLYIWGLTFMQGVTSYLANRHDSTTGFVAESAYLLELHYGSLEKTIWTLVSAVTGGVDWNDVSKPLEVTYGYYKYYFLFYVLFMIMCLLNVLTGIFVNVAMQATSMNREIAIDEAIQNRDSIVKEVVELFVEADVDGSGSLSFSEFETFMQDEKIKAFFMALELDMSSCSRIFHLLDASEDGKLEAHEFVEGCIELRGFARKVDITLLQRENKAVIEKLEDIASDMVGDIKGIRDEVLKSLNEVKSAGGADLNTNINVEKNRVKY